MFYKQFDTFVFDYDGTLFDSLQHALIVFKIVGQQAHTMGLISKIWSDEFITSVIGHNPLKAWEVLLPSASHEQRTILSALYSKTMLEHLSKTETKWYPHASEVVQTLLDEHKSCVLLTNARRYYVDIALSQHPLLKRFDHVVCAQDFNYQNKADIIKQLPLKGNVVVIGDKLDDALAAQSIHAYSLWAAYGYGQNVIDGKYFTSKLDSIQDLIQKPSI